MALCLFSYNIGVAQNYHSGAITDKNNQTIEGRVSIDNNSKKVYCKKNGNLKTYNFKDLNGVTLGNDVYSKITFNNIILHSGLKCVSFTFFPSARYLLVTFRKDSIPE